MTSPSARFEHLNSQLLPYNAILHDLDELVPPNNWWERLCSLLTKRREVWRDHIQCNPYPPSFADHDIDYLDYVIWELGIDGELTNHEHKSLIQHIEKEISNRQNGNTGPGALSLEDLEEGLSLLAKCVDYRQGLANSPHIAVFDSSDHVTTLIHVATGISASFHREGDFGFVYAKNYSNPDMPKLGNMDYCTKNSGYGVGRRLYLCASALWPNIRWEDRAYTSRPSTRLREYLHESDPYTWEYMKCQYCGGAWKTKDRSQISACHPRMR